MELNQLFQQFPAELEKRVAKSVTFTHSIFVLMFYDLSFLLVIKNRKYITNPFKKPAGVERNDKTDAV